MKELQEMPYQKIPLTEIKCLRIVYAEFYAKNASKESKKWLIAPDYNLEVLKIRI